MSSLGIFAMSWRMVAALCLCGAGMTAAQEGGTAATSTAAKNPDQATSTGAPALKLTLQDALVRAKKNSVPFQSALTDSAIARQDRWQAGAALLPSVTYDNQAWYTQLNKTNDVFVRRVIRDEDYIISLVELGVPRLIVVGHAGEQRCARLPSVLPSYRRIGERGLKWHAVFSRAHERILQC